MSSIALGATTEIRKRLFSWGEKSASKSLRVTAAHGLRALNVTEESIASKSKYDANPHLNDAGKAANLRKDMDGVAKRLCLSRIGIEKATANYKAEVATIIQKAFSSLAVDAMSAEIRAALKDLPLNQKIAIAQKDVRVLAALYNAPEFLHRVPDNALAAMAQNYMESKFPSDLARAQAQDKAADNVLEGANAALRVAQDTLFSLGAFPHSKAFEDWVTEKGTPTAADIETESNGSAAAGLPTWSTSESIDAIMSDGFAGMPK